MAASGRGGYQKPSHPAPVSGVGKNSRRTDGQPVQAIMQPPPGQPYGDAQQFLNEQRSAPLAAGPQAVQAPQAPVAPAGMPSAPGGQSLAGAVTPLDAPSQRPGEPVTHGAATGAGAGPSVLNLPPPEIQAQQTAAAYIQNLAKTSNNPAVSYLAQNIRGSY